MDGWMNEWIDGHWTDVWTLRFPLYSTGHHPRFGAAAQKEIGKEREGGREAQQEAAPKTRFNELGETSDGTEGGLNGK